MRHGFTLVELSIVLVIIGLLIGGILAAQSMITTAKINSVAMQIGQFDAGVENFRTKYNCLPGDCIAFGGDGDGLITMGVASGYPQTLNSYVGEIPNFWNNIFPEQYAKVPYTVPGGPPVISGAGKNIPISKLGITNSFFIASANSTGLYQYYIPTPIPANTFNYYAIVSPAIIPTAFTNCCYQLSPTSTSSAVKPVDLLALDKKIDDGIGNTGNVLAGNFPNAGDGSGYLSTTPLATCFAGSAYKINNNSYQCTPLIRIGTQSGDLQ